MRTQVFIAALGFAFALLSAPTATAQPDWDCGGNRCPGSDRNDHRDDYRRDDRGRGGNWQGGFNLSVQIPLNPPRIPQSPGYGYGYGYQPQPYTVYEWRCWDVPAIDQWGRVWGMRQTCGNVPVTYWR